ncbi:hypothetical protein E2C06_36605 [Dankookia rubra]|uniref:Uncharacterized protein n=1 Tax=Dankookia rubra TaxID=1442381 RepID=A0A4R5PZH4_9PROT|nr:hypothetical protein [Dankookia rubra]TDH54700.1 hypothetical protein E2C06_36605 [Dankookia rubra]
MVDIIVPVSPQTNGCPGKPGAAQRYITLHMEIDGVRYCRLVETVVRASKHALPADEAERVVAGNEAADDLMQQWERRAAELWEEHELEAAELRKQEANTPPSGG